MAPPTLTADLPSALQETLGSNDLIVFDGVCVLCSGFFRFMLARDRAVRFRFATAQSPVGQALYRALDLPTEVFETNLVILDGRVYRKSDAFFAAMRGLGWPWAALAALRIVPRALRDPLYDLIARNRYRLFGRTDQCMVPSAVLRGRFLDGLAMRP